MLSLSLIPFFQKVAEHLLAFVVHVVCCPTFFHECVELFARRPRNDHVRRARTVVQSDVGGIFEHVRIVFFCNVSLCQKPLLSLQVSMSVHAGYGHVEQKPDDFDHKRSEETNVFARRVTAVFPHNISN